jgi:6,7-dimethyl-8-ribityllumazine synthase
MSENKPAYIYRLDNSAEVRVAIVRSLFNEVVTSRLEEAAVEGLLAGGIEKKNISFLPVPGAMEIPLASQFAFESGFDAVVAVGCVIRGETSHYETVCNASERGCMDVQLKFSRPVGFGVIMTEDKEQAAQRSGGRHGNKGFEAAQAAIRLLQIKRELKRNSSEIINKNLDNNYALPREFYGEPSNYSE